MIDLKYYDLIIALKNGHTEVAKSLIYFKVELNAQDNKGRTALHFGSLLSRLNDFLFHK